MTLSENCVELKNIYKKETPRKDKEKMQPRLEVPRNTCVEAGRPYAVLTSLHLHYKVLCWARRLLKTRGKTLFQRESAKFSEDGMEGGRAEDSARNKVRGDGKRKGCDKEGEEESDEKKMRGEWMNKGERRKENEGDGRRREICEERCGEGEKRIEPKRR